MAKSPEVLILATQYYVECQMSLAEISRRLTVSVRTLSDWKKENDWDNKRSRFLKSQYSTNQTLYELLHLLAKKAIDDFKEEGVLPDQKTLYFIMNMADKLPKLKSYERQEAQEKVEELNNSSENELTEKSKAPSEEILQKVFAALMS